MTLRSLIAASLWSAASFFLAHGALASTLDFTAKSLDSIRVQFTGKPFILSVWSANGCTYCLKELAMFGELVKQHPDLPLVFVSIDNPDFVPQIEALLARHGLADKPSWVFNDAIPERPRRAIDRSWRGELPRTYLYDAQHEREGVSGVISPERLQAWMAANLGHKN